MSCSCTQDFSGDVQEKAAWCLGSFPFPHFPAGRCQGMPWAPQAAVAWGQDTAGGSKGVPGSAGMELFPKDRGRNPCLPRGGMTPVLSSDSSCELLLHSPPQRPQELSLCSPRKAQGLFWGISQHLLHSLLPHSSPEWLKALKHSGGAVESVQVDPETP